MSATHTKFAYGVFYEQRGRSVVETCFVMRLFRDSLPISAEIARISNSISLEIFFLIFIYNSFSKYMELFIGRYIQILASLARENLSK